MKLLELIGVFHKPICHFYHWGSGREVKISVTDSRPDILRLEFKRKIQASDISQGNLISITEENITKKGGKRSASVEITYDTALALQIVLKKALADATKRKMYREATGMTSSGVDLTVEMGGSIH